MMTQPDRFLAICFSKSNNQLFCHPDKTINQDNLERNNYEDNINSGDIPPELISLIIPILFDIKKLTYSEFEKLNRDLRLLLCKQ